MYCSSLQYPTSGMLETSALTPADPFCVTILLYTVFDCMWLLLSSDCVKLIHPDEGRKRRSVDVLVDNLL